jgi:diguanylate cyclase (GGDEF)-like protein
MSSGTFSPRSRRPSIAPTAVMLLTVKMAVGSGSSATVDIDRFKPINDTHGHIAGDTLIHTVGHIMATELGVFGPVGRLGGEEFALLSS